MTSVWDRQRYLRAIPNKQLETQVIKKPANQRIITVPCMYL